MRRLKITGISVAVLFLLFLLLNRIFPLPDRIEYSTIITDDKGEVMHAFLTHDQQWRMKTELAEISPLLRKTIVEKEDKYFYYHPGINPVAMLRALGRNVVNRRRTSGASTITMQVARALEPKRRTYWGKMREMFRALQLEWKYSKDEILQMYLNQVPYGGNIQGVKAASVLYFKKNPDHLSLAEITALSIIPNRPTSLVMGKNNDRIVEERNRWLRRWAKEKVFTDKEISDALAEPLTATRGAVPGFVPQLALKLKKRGGPIVHSTIQLNMQLKLEKLVKDYSRTLALKNIRNAAVIVLDNVTHRVVSYVGSADFRDATDGGQVNGAAAIRQPGSTLKPLLYGLCIDEGLLTPKRVITDVPVNYDGYAPENYDRRFNGYVTMEYALEHSLNIPAVKSLKALGKDRLIRKLTDCDFRQVDKDRRKLGLSMILGGCGATLEELTGLYSIFANDGKYVRPLYVSTDSVGKGVRVLSPAAAFMINETLSKVNRPDFPLNWESTVHLPKIAWKTGTSYGRRDGWSIGYNKRYTVGIWVGNFSGLGIPEISGANVATPLLFTVFNTIDYDDDASWFGKPEDCDVRTVCSETGLPPTDDCTHLVTDYFIPLVSTAKKCDNRQELFVSADEKMTYCRVCLPSAGYKKKWYTVIPPEMKEYFEMNRISYQHIPPHNPACERLFREEAPVVTSPANGSEYLINRKDPEPLLLRCRVSNDVAKVFWYINDKFYKSGEAGAKEFFFPGEGPVKISCTDDKGRNRNVWIRVRYVNL
ncbi:MAG TPA: penicillin-binding protein 1C [Puia sp.]|uniref:penicillin-binding protein 1C n=1 Tax=Puia sp. TaxID=2045100 RepID=UPI002B8A149A|nr:penicillin-binding protein 1C [Puia sp.]HVU99400.1 penicillin-binding protein 1C [Puia sp.]